MGPTTRRSYGTMVTSLAAVALFARAGAALNAMTYKGCYSTSTPLTEVGFYQYQSSGYCQPLCANNKKAAVLGLSNGSDCWCGDELPPAANKVDDSKCDIPCNGFGTEKCGGNGFYTVYLSGLKNDVTEFQGQAASGSSSSSTTPSVVTSISPGNTVVITVSATPTGSSNGGGSGTSVAGIAAGVVVGVVGFAAIAGGLFFLLRRRRRQQAEADYKRSAQVSDFMSGSTERKAPNTAYSQMSDSRLDPEHGRRNSVGSMADDHDYSRRILRVANPDSH